MTVYDIEAVMPSHERPQSIALVGDSVARPKILVS